MRVRTEWSLIGVFVCVGYVGTAIAEDPATSSTYNAWRKSMIQIERYNDEGRFGEAAKLGGEVLRTAEQTFGPKDFELAVTLDGVGTAYVGEKRLSEAEPLLLRALSIFESTRGSAHIDTAVCWHHLASLRLAQQRPVDAELALLQHVIPIYERTAGAESSSTGRAWRLLASTYKTQERYSEAEVAARHALTINEKTLGAEDRLTGIAVSELAEIVCTQGRAEESEALYQRADAIFSKTRGDTDLVELHESHSQCLKILGKMKGIDQFEASPVR